ncbi:MAG: hypothetical protein QM372_03820 [Bacillota bacterium]|nr:hypothetical protein [Bacillota bacterium]
MMHLLTGISLALLWGLMGSVLRHKTKLSSVAVSALLTLLAALVLPRLFVNGHLFALICTAVSYVTMSSTERLAKVWETLTVSVFCALAVYFGQNLLVGIGGRLGTFAALSVLFFTIPKAHKHLIFGRR